MTCYNDYLFVEFLVDILVLDLKVDVNRIHITGLSNGAQAMLHEIMNLLKVNSAVFLLSCLLL